MTQSLRTQHHTSTPAFGIRQPAFIRKQLQLCSTRLNNLAELYDEFRLMGAPVERRELPAGARERFFESVSSSARMEPKDATAKVASIASASERRNDGADSPRRAAKFAIGDDPTTAFSQGKRPLIKRSLLPVSRQSRGIRGIQVGHSKSRFTTAIAAATNAVAARFTGIL